MNLLKNVAADNINSLASVVTEAVTQEIHNNNKPGDLGKHESLTHSATPMSFHKYLFELLYKAIRMYRRIRLYCFVGQLHTLFSTICSQ